MAGIRVPNHPAGMTGLFEPLSESIPEAVRGNMYGNITTPSYLQCAGAYNQKLEDFDLTLITNTAFNNVLELERSYYLSGKLIALNDGSTPVFTYTQDLVAPAGATSDTTVDSLGIVVSREEVLAPGETGDTHLEVFERCHRRFQIMYIVPGSKLYAKTHNLYIIGREVKIIGRLVDFNMEKNMAVVLVSSVAVTSGHQIGKGNLIASTSNSTPPHTKAGRQPTKFTPTKSTENAAPPTPSTPKPRATTSQGGVSGSKKGKARADPPSEVEDESCPSEDSDIEFESDPEAKPKPRGRPRKQVLKEAAKRMKRS
ncbi:hypothetical protein PTTG_29497 [Puccinia triticina 1-1 BBBD Race 1]|uniref:Uncharacterized protein n=1 Tax=Puccinia triticina (isolate 1-1 / race 1 (BBBD)) TaxID=630390 RepID=A0A180G5Z3_PUCT1|nr:hypothetical protein PTTG_29497 [Puccinia triticina 1-1 BBBD Race 1]